MFILSFLIVNALALFGSSHGLLRTTDNAIIKSNDTIVVSSFSVANNCTEDSDCNYRGICTNINVCQCYDGYTTFPENHSTGCNYKQKSALTALLLQFFFGFFFGAGYFYLGVIDLAVGELFLFWGGLIFACVLGCIFVCVKNNYEENPNYDIVSATTNLFVCLVMIGCATWWIYSMVKMGNGIQLDGNGATLAD